MTKRRDSKLLTESETRIAEGYASGFIGKEIADKLGVSYNTVVRHTQNIYDKTGIRRSTNSLAAWFLSKRYGFDLSEVERQFGAFLLLILFSAHMVLTDFDSQFVRSSSRRVEARQARRRRRENGENTFYLEL